MVPRKTAQLFILHLHTITQIYGVYPWTIGLLILGSNGMLWCTLTYGQGSTMNLFSIMHCGFSMDFLSLLL